MNAQKTRLIDEDLNGKGMKRMEDAAIVELFWQRSEDAIRQTDEKYGKLCRHLANNILRNLSDAEECVNDSYFRVWNRIPEERPTFFQAFLCRIVKNISLDRIKFETAKKRSPGGVACIDELEECVASHVGSPEEAADENALTQAIAAFLKAQSDYTRRIFIRRYWYCDSLQEIASDYGESESKIASQLFRTRQKLREHLKGEGFAI